MTRFDPVAQILPLAAFALAALVPGRAAGSRADDEKAVAALDTEYQAAVGLNDADTMAESSPTTSCWSWKGAVYESDLLKSARDRDTIYEKQVEIDGSQKVRVWGDTAVVTAKLWIKGSQKGQAFDKKLWFSDTYVRMKDGWKYVFGQSSIALPDEP
jgi:ketosteroid isomerase-like protein